MGYLASPFWMAQLVIGIVLVLQSKYIRPEYFTADFSLFPTWPVFDYVRALAPVRAHDRGAARAKFLGLIAALFDSQTRRGCGGAIRSSLSTLLEILVSAAVAPIMMLIQTGSVVQIVSGRDTGWNPQRRDDGSIPFRSIARRHRSHMAMGFVALIAAGLLSPSLVVWMSPTIAGLILADSDLLGERAVVDRRRAAQARAADDARGDRARRRSSRAPMRSPQELANTGHDDEDGLRAIAVNPEVPRGARIVPARAPRHRRGDIDVDEAVATAKLNDARTLDEALRLAEAQGAARRAQRPRADLIAGAPSARDDRSRKRSPPVGGVRVDEASVRLTALARGPAVEQREGEEAGDEAADMRNPGDRRVRGPERGRADAEQEIGRHPDRDEDQRAPWLKTARRAARLASSLARRRPRPRDRPAPRRAGR